MQVSLIDATGADASPGAAREVIHKRVLVEGDLDDEQQDRLHRIGDRCPVHRLLESAARIDSTLEHA